ncbi:tctex1 domain-containing protein 2 [Diaphorina citri]|uniref:Tctex1 domain-containing protein 2 n=1 Tax=Diaphorina citri TaxID=121845 RepID=A0A1S4EST1_DIACI|nr:tctex1 domain-containing protein 2 [Diaphorina citri]
MADEEGEGELVSPNTDILDAEVDEAHPDFNIKPSLKDKFKPGKAKEIIRAVLEEEFKDKPYDGKQSNQIVQKLSKIIKSKVEAVTHQNYKIVVEVTLVEQRGAGIRSDLKCIWDSDADGLASEVFISEHLVCHASVIALYYY